MKDEIVMEGVTEYGENYPVKLVTTTNYYSAVSSIVVLAKNEGGHNCTEVDLRQLLSWVAANRPDLYMDPVSAAMIENSAYWRTPVYKGG